MMEAQDDGARGDVSPIDTLRARNRELERLLTERTADVEAARREAEVEAALERVRARAMAMHSSDELAEVVALVFNELTRLDFALTRCIISIVDPDTMSCRWWMANSEDPTRSDSYYIKYNDHPVHLTLLGAWKERHLQWVYDLCGEDKASYDVLLFTETELTRLPLDVQTGMRAPESVILSVSFNNFGWLLAASLEPLSDANLDILRRFGQVFDMTYTRFDDLQKAEAQAREAQIEAALERIRGRALAMRSSDELKDVAFELRLQMGLLGQQELEVCLIHLYDDDPDTFESWWGFRLPGEDGDIMTGRTRFPRGVKIMEETLTNYASEVDDYIVVNEGEKALEWMAVLQEYAPEFYELIRPIVEAARDEPFIAYWAFSDFSGGSLGMVTYQPPDEDSRDLLRRCARVFDLAYTRFLDLKKAEAQAREAQIEAALERVRARTMAMHRSDELREVVSKVFEEFQQLDFSAPACSIGIFDEETRASEWWVATTSNIILPRSYRIPYLEAWPKDWYQTVYDNWQQGTPFFSMALEGEAKRAFDHKMVSETEFGLLSEDEGTIEDIVPLERLVLSYATLTHGVLEVGTTEPISDALIPVLQRFAQVIDLTYTRFDDLQRAEAQAREAQIEAALERVRARAMAMHSSEDLAATISTLFRELKALNIMPMRCGVGLIDGATRLCELITSSATAQGDALELVGTMKLEGHPALEGIFEYWKRQEEYYHVLQGEDLQRYYQLLKPSLAVPDWQDDVIQHGHFFYFPEGGLYAWSERAFAEEELRIFRKFSSVLGLTYRRHLDLHEAEARAREAVKAASLDRVRAEIASMRTADDLERITPLVWRELTTLGVPFFRCGVFIMDEATERVHTYLSTPEGASLAVLHLPFDSVETTRQAVAHWRRRAVYRDLWNRAQFTAWVQAMIEQGHLEASEAYQGGAEPPEQLALQFVPFTQGMLYVGSAELLAEDHVDLVQALADAFAVAYARYEDFQRLEAAKAEVEDALADLKATQTQLIHAEKMASLGQMTAGIAHEIKNPLNFVNNFAELNEELADELREELAAGAGLDEVDDLLETLKGNAGQIAKHGKRADAIVRAMMLHARGSSGEREPTDLNGFVEEYLNLAYHGMRAQSPGFNVTLERGYDEAVGRILLMPQEMGRVFINLLNNAFYAVHEQGQNRADGYEPTVTVRTRRCGDTVEIVVQDNGPGISASVLEKIFEPFYTTKPTGSGTGLGLSLSYDIITQGHGGALRVDSREEEGAVFTITLPAG